MSLKAGRVLFLTQEALGDLSSDEQALLLARLNAYNPKLLVDRLLPLPEGKSFGISRRADSNRFALIAEAYGETLAPNPVDLQSDEGSVGAENGTFLQYRAVLYLFISPPDFAGRNVFVTQTIFPGLCALIDEMRTAPGIAFSAHPVYFLDRAPGRTPESVRRTLMLFAAMGIGYVALRRTDFDPADIPRDLDELLLAAGDKQRAGRPYYSIDEHNRTLTFTTSAFERGLLLSADRPASSWNFKGSQDKFYWSEVLPVAVVAAHSGYRIDCSEVVTYLARVRSDAEADQRAASAKNGKKSRDVKLSNKFHRTVALFDYIEKISEI